MNLGRNLFSLAICTLCFFPAFSQQFNYYIGINSQSNYVEKTSFSSLRSIFLPISDSLYIKSLQQVKTDRTTTTELKTSLQAGIEYRKALGSHWSFLAGLGINLGRLKLKSLFNETSIQNLRIDTLDTDPFSDSPYLIDCDINIIRGEYSQPDPTYTILQLVIPVMLRYDIVPRKWSLGIGGKLSTPVYIGQKRLVNTFTRTVNEANQIVCTNEYKVVRDKSGSGFSRLNIGLVADMEYWLDRLGFGIGVEKRVTNLFQKDFFDYYDVIPTKKAMPLISYLRVMYRFNPSS